jgi:SPP1 family predicted phage head-tail adaptor
VSKYLKAQSLNQRVAFERPAAGKDEFGQPTVGWEHAFYAWAHVKTLTGAGFMSQEFQTGGVEVSRPTASVRVRARPGITADMRVVLKGQPYEIRVVLPDLQDNRYVDLGVATGANNG